MNSGTPEKFGTIGAVFAAAACPICFPKIALVGALAGLGVFAPFEGYVAVGAALISYVRLRTDALVAQ